MEKRKLLIADSNPEFISALKSVLSDTFSICDTTNGHQALELLDSFAPDVMVLDVVLAGLDGIRVLEQARGHKMKVLVTTLVCTDYILSRLAQLDISYLLLKPCDLEMAAERVREIAGECDVLTAAEPDEGQKLTAVLMELGLNPKHNGYRYLCEAIAQYRKNSNQLLTKELYTAVGRKFGVSAQQVERSIRTAIEWAWLRRDERIWHRWFPAGMLSATKHPTNGELICALSQLLQLEQTRKIG